MCGSFSVLYHPQRHVHQSLSLMPLLSVQLRLDIALIIPETRIPCLEERGTGQDFPPKGKFRHYIYFIFFSLTKPSQGASEGGQGAEPLPVGTVAEQEWG